jgi:hypothetical protein
LLDCATEGLAEGGVGFELGEAVGGQRQFGGAAGFLGIEERRQGDGAITDLDQVFSGGHGGERACESGALLLKLRAGGKCVVNISILCRLFHKNWLFT